jgi:hypothetical protein
MMDGTRNLLIDALKAQKDMKLERKNLNELSIAVLTTE